MAAGSDLVRRGFWLVRDLDPMRRVHRARRVALIARVRASAFWHRASVDLDVARDVRLGREVRVTVEPRTASVLRIGAGATLGDRVLVLLKGGEVLIGPGCDLRRDTVLNVAGRLELVGRNILSWGNLVHCAESVRLEEMASAAEQVTIADSSHFFTEPDAFFYDNVRTAPIAIGANTWLCPKVTVTSGVTVGAHCILASNSVIHVDVPDGHLASGVPATSIRRLDLPWR